MYMRPGKPAVELQEPALVLPQQVPDWQMDSDSGAILTAQGLLS